jgi:hypothetical protein
LKKRPAQSQNPTPDPETLLYPSSFRKSLVRKPPTSRFAP